MKNKKTISNIITGVGILNAAIFYGIYSTTVNSCITTAQYQVWICNENVLVVFLSLVIIAIIGVTSYLKIESEQKGQNERKN